MKQRLSACIVAGLEIARSHYVILVRAVVFDNVDEPEVLTQMLVVRDAPLDAAITKEAIESPSLDYTPKGLGIKTQTERVCNVMQQVLSKP